MKTTEQFPHEKFLEENNIDSKTLPEMLYKRIQGFDELKEDLEHTTDEDKEKLIHKLEMLSHELSEDLEEHFEDHLANNDQEEEEPEVAAEPIQEEPAPDPEPEIKEPEVEIQEEKIEPEPEPEVTEPTDEEILEGLFADKKHHLLPSDLRKKGFKTSLNSKRVLVGKFCLHRAKYDTCYQLVLKSE